MLFGEAELQQGVLKIKDLDANTEEVVAQVGAGGKQARGACTFHSCGGWLLESTWAVPLPSRPPRPATRAQAAPAPCCCRPAIPLPSAALQGDLVGRLQDLVKTKCDRRIVYQQKEEGGSAPPAAAAAAEASA